MLYKHSAILWQIHIAWSIPFPVVNGSIISYNISTGKVSRKKLIWITFSLTSVSICSIRQLCRILSRQKLFRRKSGSSFHEEIQAVKVYNFKSSNWSFAMKISWYEFLATILENYLWRCLILSLGFFSYFEHDFCKGLLWNSKFWNNSFQSIALLYHHDTYTVLFYIFIFLHFALLLYIFKFVCFFTKKIVLFNPFTSDLYLGFPFKKAHCFGVKILSMLVIKEKTESL